ncbi:acyl-CoA dehydrogenase family protein [Mycolicibacter hiberniae]|uniref:Acyl-CoA dehydrogenase n=1 Tax=Mycolicibacter hiberniae TaxID=29314 RepID=A0A7I7WXM3_9MYCO|nr:acyl-CoA dehydrogenase family protein [Mycolicibacter hiberniae]MCV7086878.1 acyl-CoA/acyl-ACP dehydrogenase [Mycolicibacter hiberniae]ORV70877.1 acyl-CoA dehydrogenase [Mycolicibacter hiberniae]BBZ21822.1 acyl-CoA dehydrogenase [Mycolicibacter hiberniae]
MTTTDFAELHDDLRAVAADVVGRGREVDWSTMADAGWLGLEVPEALGGAGATFAEAAVICEQLGRAAAASHYLGGAVLTAGVLNSLQDSATRDALLSDLAVGRSRIATVPGGSFVLDGAGRLTGSATFALDADGADRLVVLATEESGDPVAVLAEGCTVTPQAVLDETRRIATVTAEGTAVADSAVLRFADPHGAQAVRHRAAAAVACDSLGLAEAMLAATVTYAQTREQFGRPIGSFQAVKHACADMLVKVTMARTLVRDAVRAVATNSPEVDVAVAMAKSYTCTAAVDVVGKALQLHGGIGYTWESGIHVYLKRATFNRSLFGSPAAHRRRLAQRY